MMAAPNSFVSSAGPQRFAWQGNPATSHLHPGAASSVAHQNEFVPSQHVRSRGVTNPSSGMLPPGMPLDVGAGQSSAPRPYHVGEAMAGSSAVWSSPFGRPQMDMRADDVTAGQIPGGANHQSEPMGGPRPDGGAPAPGANSDMQKAVMQMMFNTVADNLSTQAASQVSQLQKWFPSAIAVLRPYFSVSQTSVRQRLLQLLFPFLSLWRSTPAAGARSLPAKDFGGDSSHAGSNPLPRDLYTPLMALVTYVLLYALTRGAANDFRPELLGSTASIALLLLAAEVLVAKVSFYVSGAGAVSTLDLFSFCGYKYVHLALLIAVRLFLNALASLEGSRASGAAVPLSAEGAAEGSVEVIDGGEDAGIRAASPDAPGGQSAVESPQRGEALINGASITWIFTVAYVYLFACAAAELLVLLRGATTRCSQENEAAGWQVSRDASRLAGPKSVIFALTLLQVPLCWLLTPSFAAVKGT
ncbi:Hrf1 family protein [Besnoitia besnoiti]|uniref:Hrf1 family protein n=1 Tax=Besnoitia besnoiti TaxID=94643 RepID=A0A2A9MIX8_BESBE|nr:Hrf1 family protein [Besnoitia besnoiti]PFH35547.1 Hrf1 family protein [Besnoitia besnoiti]